MKKRQQIRDEIRIAMQIAEEMRETARAYRETLTTIFADEEIPLEIRQQYERLLVTQLTVGGVF
jgi:hypothetical protein